MLRTQFPRIGVAIFGLALAVFLVAKAPAREPVAPTTAAAPSQPNDHSHTRRNGIDDRVQLMAREFDLDAHQQAELRLILWRQKAEVDQVWKDESQPASLRVAATRAIGHSTADRIRGILDGKQRERYSKPWPALQQPTADNLESLINATGRN